MFVSAAGKLIEPKRIYFLEKSGVEIIIADTIVPDIEWALRALYRQGICSALLEGGATLTASFLKSKQVDQVYLFLPGKIIENLQAPSWTGDLQISKLTEIPTIQFENIEKVGDNILVIGSFKSYS
ncbi:MAG: hypothetical protein HOD92_04890 [Deltaproteobacteria bacterium]|jgi:diaminohydroxyphosphoribosylaminopyrimidine deaminase / 5-amino-6-(5-phosphoribosylamino)uracil reductase|nr:hypothetical protein [Deltaproteobacteria bacterium]MBT4525127.1 hypothetical protein [Deltaproteobacteria bacterium]